MKKICIVVSSPLTIKAFLLKHIQQLVMDYDVTIVSSGDIDLQKEYALKVHSKNIDIQRQINLFADLKSFFKLYLFFKREKFDLVLSVTPKAGLLTSLASYLSGIKNRIHFFTGQVWATKRGAFRFVLKSMDRLIARFTTHQLIDSFSQRDFLLVENVIKKNNSNVLLKGSISGVDVDKFKAISVRKKELCEQYNIKSDDIVFMFIGRLNVDKGIYDLNKLFLKLFEKYSNIKLFLVGPDEENILSQIVQLLSNENLIRLDYVSNPQDILNVTDILVLPSYREGFGTIVIEAASMAIPCIGSNIYGLNDAIINNHTGILHEVKNIEDMMKKYEYMINNPSKIRELGLNAQKRVYEYFKDDYLSYEFKKFVDSILRSDRK